MSLDLPPGEPLTLAETRELLLLLTDAVRTVAAGHAVGAVSEVAVALDRIADQMAKYNDLYRLANKIH